MASSGSVSETLNSFYSYDPVNCTLANAPLGIADGSSCSGFGTCLQGVCCCADMHSSFADVLSFDGLSCHTDSGLGVAFWVGSVMCWFYTFAFHCYAIFKAFDSFKKQNKRTRQVRSILSYFPFRIILPPAFFSVGVVPLLKMFTELRIGVDMGFTVYYSFAISMHIILMNESTIKQYTQLRSAEEIIIPLDPAASTNISSHDNKNNNSQEERISSSASRNHTASGPVVPQQRRGTTFRICVRLLDVLFIASQALLIAAVDANSAFPSALQSFRYSDRGQCDAGQAAVNMSGTALQTELELYLTERTQSSAALLLVFSNLLVCLYFALSIFATQTLYLKLLEFNESLENTATMLSIRQTPRSMNELRKSLGFMADTARANHRAAIAIVLLFIIFTLPWLWPHQQYKYALFSMVLVPPFIAHLKTFAGGVRFGIDDSPGHIHAAAERAPLALRINGNTKGHKQEHTSHSRHHTRSTKHQQKQDGGMISSTRLRANGSESENAGRTSAAKYKQSRRRSNSDYDGFCASNKPQTRSIDTQDEEKGNVDTVVDVVDDESISKVDGGVRGGSSNAENDDTRDQNTPSFSI